MCKSERSCENERKETVNFIEELFPIGWYDYHLRIQGKFEIGLIAI